MEFLKMPIIRGMNGMTISEMAKALNVPPATVKKRLLRAGRKPFSQEALYTEDDFEAIRNVPGRGRPPKAKPETVDKPKKDKK
jgi:predicted ArsR family transcriptional regulator